MAISYNTGATHSADTASSVTLGIPAGVLTGDLMILNIEAFTETGTAPSVSISGGGGSWTAVPMNTGTNPEVATAGSTIWSYGYAYYRIATAADPGATLTVSETGSSAGTTWFAVAVAAYTGAGSIDVAFGSNAQGTGSATAPSGSTTQAGDWAVYLMGGGINSGPFTGPGTQRQNLESDAFVCAGINDSNGSVGASGTTIGGGTWTQAGNTSDWWSLFTIGINAPAVGTNASASPAAGAAVAPKATAALTVNASPAAATAAAVQPSVAAGSGGNPTPAAVVAAAVAPSTAVTVHAGAAAAAAGAGGPTGASTLTMKFASTDGNGVETWTSNSPMNSGGNHACRIMRPTAAPAGTPHAFLYCLPVDVEGVTTWGSALDILRANGYHNKYNITLIEPTFGGNPWYADNPNDPTLRHESFTLAIAAWCQANLAITGAGPAVQGNEANHLIGFSKSGLGGMGLLMNHPGVFGKAALWDTPFDMTAYDRFDPNSTGAYGTQASFAANYETNSANVSRAHAQLQVMKRIWIGSGVLYASEMADFDTLLTSLSIPHAYASTNTGDGVHEFASQWVLPGADSILPATGDPSHPGIASAPQPAAAIGAAAGAATATATAMAPGTGGGVSGLAGAAAGMAAGAAAAAIGGIAGIPAGLAAAPGAAAAVTANAAAATLLAAAPGPAVQTFAGTAAPAGVAATAATSPGPALTLTAAPHAQAAQATAAAASTAAPASFRVARGTATVTAQDTSAATVTDPRDGTAGVT